MGSLCWPPMESGAPPDSAGIARLTPAPPPGAKPHVSVEVPRPIAGVTAAGAACRCRRGGAGAPARHAEPNVERAHGSEVTLGGHVGTGPAGPAFRVHDRRRGRGGRSGGRRGAVAGLRCVRHPCSAWGCWARELKRGWMGLVCSLRLYSPTAAFVASSSHQYSEHSRPAAPAGFRLTSYAPVSTSATIRHTSRTHSNI